MLNGTSSLSLGTFLSDCLICHDLENSYFLSIQLEFYSLSIPRFRSCSTIEKPEPNTEFLYSLVLKYIWIYEGGILEITFLGYLKHFPFPFVFGHLMS